MLISENFSLSEFSASISDLMPGDIYKIAQEEINRIDRITKPGARGAPAACDAGALEYRRELKRLCFCITHLKKPSGATTSEIGFYKTIFTHAVHLGVLQEADLPQFLR